MWVPGTSLLLLPRKRLLLCIPPLLVPFHRLHHLEGQGAANSKEEEESRKREKEEEKKMEQEALSCSFTSTSVFINI